MFLIGCLYGCLFDMQRMVRRDMHGTTYLTEAERALMVAWMRFERHPGNSYFSDYIMPDR